MRYLIMVRATARTEAGELPDEAIVAAMAAWHEELARAGVLLDANGLKPTSRGWRVRYEGGRPTIVDGPFTEAKELVAGYTLIQARSPEEARELTRRFPSPMGEHADGEIEVRELYEFDDFGELPGMDRFRALQPGTR